LLDTLQQVWRSVSHSFDVLIPMPEPSILFEAVPLDRAYEAAELVVVNMLSEVIECVDRFSPWYTKPAHSFGLTTKMNAATNRVTWRLTDKGAQRWWPQIESLAAVIQKNGNLIAAMIFVDDLMTAVTNEDTLVLAQCHCLPCRYIRLKKSILSKSEIICDLCHKPFFPTDHYPGLDYHT
jgi:hypothetical protein